MKSGQGSLAHTVPSGELATSGLDSETTSPVFSVVICTYNRAEIVGRAIESVRSQTFTDFELIVVNDGSADHTRSVLDSYVADELRAIHRENGGLSAARNTGIRASSGRFVIFLDDDDWVEPGWLGTLADIIGNDTGVASGACLILDGDHRLHVKRRPAQHPIHEDFVGLFLAGTFAVDRTVLLAVGGYDEQIRVSHQTELMMRVIPELQLRSLRAVATDEVVATIERRPIENRPLSQPIDLLHGALHMIEQHGDALGQNSAELASYHAIAGNSAARLGRSSEARTHFINAWRLEPFRPRRLLQVIITSVPTLSQRMWPVSS